MLLLSITFPYCMGPIIHLCHRPNTKGKKCFKKTTLIYPFNGLITLDIMPLKENTILYVTFFFLGWMSIFDQVNT